MYAQFSFRFKSSILYFFMIKKFWGKTFINGSYRGLSYKDSPLLKYHSVAYPAMRILALGEGIYWVQFSSLEYMESVKVP